MDSMADAVQSGIERWSWRIKHLRIVQCITIHMADLTVIMSLLGMDCNEQRLK